MSWAGWPSPLMWNRETLRTAAAQAAQVDEGGNLCEIVVGRAALAAGEFPADAGYLRSR